MPGNEVGDRVHNFFGQENLAQGQRHPQAVDGNWPGLTNNMWVGNQPQVGSPVNSSLKNYNTQPVTDYERVHGSQSMHVPHGLNFMQSNVRPEFGRVQSQIQQPTLNGYMHGHQMFQTSRNEANFLGADTESEKEKNLTSRGLSTSELRGSGPEHAKSNMTTLETSESPVGFNFFGGQQQMSGQNLAMMQSLPRQQQPSSSDMQLQRQAMFSQIQEFQRQQQLQKQQQAFANQASVAKQAAGNHSPALMNGVTFSEASNNQRLPNVVAGNTNWLQRGASPVVQGGSSGYVLSHEQAQALRSMGFTPQQADQSLYGVPVSSSSGTPGSYAHFQMDKPETQQSLVSRNVSPGNQYAAYAGAVSMRDGSLPSRQNYQGKNTVGPMAAQSLNGGFSSETLHRVNPQQRNDPMEEIQGRHELVGLSEPSPEKSAMQVAPSQAVATLDPTEEKILFGSDDNLWDAFGGSNNVGMGGSSILDGTDILGGLSSVQSGTWSALMQSAVAETSSIDGGLQEEWCGPTSRNPEPPVGTHQPSSVGDANKQQSSWAVNNIHSSSDLNGRPSLHFANANRPSTSDSSYSIQGFQEPGQARGDMLQTDSFHRFMSQSPEQSSKWLDRNSLPQPPTDSNHNSYGTISRSSDREINANSISGSWNHQERSSSQNNNNQLKNMSNGWNFNESVSTDVNNYLKYQGNQILPHSTEGRDLKRGMHEETNRASGMWKTDSSPYSNIEVAHPKYAYHHPPSGRMKESAIPDTGDSGTLPGSKQHSSGNAGQKPSGTRQFQYHPMGDVGVKVEPSGRKQLIHSQAMSQQVPQGFRSHNLGSYGHSNFTGHTGRTSMDIEKALVEPPSESTLPGSAPSTSTPFDRSTGSKDDQPSKATRLSSQHMLELLHKVDHPREQVNGSHLSPSDHNMSSETPEVEASDGSGHIQRNSSSVSQGYGLQLAPPSQRNPLDDHMPARSSSHAVLGSGGFHADMGEKGHSSTASIQSLTFSHEASLSSSKALGPQFHIQGGLSAPVEYGFPHSRSQHMTAASPAQAFRPRQFPESVDRAPTSQSLLASVQDKSGSSADASHRNIADQSPSRFAVRKVPESDAERSGTSAHQGDVPKVLKNVWTSVPFQQSPVSDESSLDQSQLFKSQSQLQTNNHLVTTSHVSQKLNDQDTQERGNAVSVFDVYSSNLQSSGPKEQSSKQHSEQQVSLQDIQTGQNNIISQGKESTASDSASTQRDIEAFGHSLRPNSSSRRYSLLDQALAMKNTEIDGSKHSMERVRDPDSDVGTQPLSPKGGPRFSYGHNTTIRDLSSDHNPVPSGDPKGLSFASKLGDAVLSNASSQDMFALGRKSFQNSSSGSNASTHRGEQSQVSPQMAPSWFDQYGSFKNGKTLPLHDTLRATVKSTEQPSISGKPADQHAREHMERPIANSNATIVPQSSALKPISSEQLVSQNLLLPDATNESATIDRPKKRKSATSELSSWHEELTKHSQKLLDLRAADADWARATNRLTEKVADEREMVRDGPPMARSKKRLILTTQLVQQLLRPPPSAVLSGDASCSFESITYFASRLSLGDACTAILCSRDDISTPPDTANLLPEKLKAHERVHLYFPKIVENFVDKASKLENDLLRLDKRTSILDLRVESQDLEKFSVINRFAKFHGRAQGDVAEGSSSSDALANSQRTCPQKYVTALPVPRNLPDRVQCLSL